MTALEFLLLNGAKAEVKDDRGQSPLHHASMLGRTGQVCQLLKRNANQNAFDDQHRVSCADATFLLDLFLILLWSCLQTPLSIAVENANADIVTMYVTLKAESIVIT